MEKVCTVHMLRDGQKSSASLQQLLPLPCARDEGQMALPVLFTYGGNLTFEFTAHVSALVLMGHLSPLSQAMLRQPGQNEVIRSGCHSLEKDHSQPIGQSSRENRSSSVDFCTVFSPKTKQPFSTGMQTLKTTSGLSGESEPRSSLKCLLIAAWCYCMSFICLPGRSGQEDHEFLSEIGYVRPCS